MADRAHTYVCLLRGINVSGQRTIRMADLRRLFGSLGFAGVESYLQSGNVVFDSKEGGASSIAARIRDNIERTFGFDVPVIVRGRGRFLEVREQNPLLGLPGIEADKLHVAFLSDAPAAANLEWTKSFDPTPERMAVVGNSVYLYCPSGYARTTMSNNFIERQLGTTATTRNWRTVSALYGILLTRP